MRYVVDSTPVRVKWNVPIKGGMGFLVISEGLSIIILWSRCLSTASLLQFIIFITLLPFVLHVAPFEYSMAMHFVNQRIIYQESSWWLGFQTNPWISALQSSHVGGSGCLMAQLSSCWFFWLSPSTSSGAGPFKVIESTAVFVGEVINNEQHILTRHFNIGYLEVLGVVQAHKQAY